MKLVRSVIAALSAVMVVFSSLAADTPPEGVTLVDLTGTGNGTASSMYASGWTDGSAATVFDDNFDNRSIYNSQTLDWRWTFNEPTVVNAYKMYACKSDIWNYGTRMPKNFRLEAKNTADADWTTLDTRTDESTAWAAKEGRYFQFDNTTAYDMYRVISTATIEGGSGYTQIAELELFFVAFRQPVLSDLAFAKKSEGIYKFTATAAKNDGYLSLLFSSDGNASVPLNLGEFTEGDSISNDVVIAETALRTDVDYTLQVIASNDFAVVTNDVAGTWYFGTPAGVDDFNMQFTLTIPNSFVGELADFPVSVKISPALVSGFEYADVKQSGNDVIFMSEEGVVYPSECEIWDSEGESLFWVRLPSAKAGDVFVCRYGTSKKVEPVDGMWTGYAGVWHLDETTAGAVAVADAAGVSPGTSHASSTIVDGQFGKARKLNLDAKNGGLVVVPKNAAINALTPEFTVSGWVNLNTLSVNWGYLFSRKTADSYSSWGLHFRGLSGPTDKVGLYSNGTSDQSGQYVLLNTANKWTASVWQKYDVVYTSTTVSLYINGVLINTQAVTPGPAVNGDNDFAIGGFPTTSGHSTLKAAQDEVRLRNGAVSADWVADEYALQSGTMVLAVGEVEPVDPTAVKFESAPTIVKSANGFTVSAKVIAGEGSVSVIYGTTYPFANTNLVTAAVTVGETYSLELTDLPAGANIGFGVVGVGTSGNVKEELGESAIITGEIVIAKGADADEGRPNMPGYFTVTRPSTATNGASIVSYTIGGTAVAGTHYVALTGSVTIPDGEASARIDVYPIAVYDGDHTLTLTVSAGPYGIAAPGAASLTVKGFRAESGFAKKIVFTTSGYAGGETLTDFPMLVRLSTAITGFDYGDFQLANGGDLRFATEDGIPLVHEVDCWDTAGESLVWVKVPSLTSATKIVAYYGNCEPWAVTSSDVWDGYVGVWHMNGGSGNETDVTGHGLTGTPTGTKLAEMVADSSAPTGAGRVNQTTSGKYNRLSVPNYNDYITDQSVFTLSGGFKSTNASGYPRPLSRKTAYNDGTGWEIQYNNGSKTQYDMRGSSSTQVATDGPDVTANWVYFTFVFNGTTGTTYANGVQKKSGTIAAVKTRTDAMAIGNNSNGSEQGWCGSYDEVRFYDGVLSASRIAADYATVTNAAFAVCTEVEPVDASAVMFSGNPIVTEDDGTFTVHVSTSVDSGEGSIFAVCTAYGATELTNLVTSAAVAASDYEVDLTQLATNTSYMAGVCGLNDRGTVTKAYASDALYNGVPEIAKTCDADEASLSHPGIFTVSRADAYGDLVINYTVGGTAVAGTDYEALSGSVTIPDGQTSATIEVTPIRTKTVDHTLTITITDGLYLLGSSAPAATMTIKTMSTPAGYNTWIADADGNASVAANWSEGRVPNTTDNILVDGRFSMASMVWDAGVNGLSDTVASWTQTFQPGDAEYTGTVTFNTVYPDKGEFTCFTVTGDCVVNCGTWTHPQSRTMGDIHDTAWDWIADLKANETYRLRLACGTLTVGANAAFDVKTKGYYASHNNSRCYASHGGTTREAAKVYGDPKEPIHIGMALRTNGNYYNGKGGGAIYITVTGDAVVDGAICADSGNTGYGTGAAGSVYLNARSVSGTGSITALGSASGEGNYKGTGGRIAIITQTAVNRSTFTAISAAAEWKNAQGGQATEFGGAGTVFFKDGTMTNGKLVVSGKSDSPSLTWANRYRVTIVGTEGDWTFDSVEFERGGRLVVMPGTALHLPNGLGSVSSTSDSVSHSGIRYEGGTLDIGSSANQTMNGPWMLTGYSNCVLNCNLTVQGGAAIGVHAISDIQEEGATLPGFLRSSVEVRGDLTIASDGSVRATCGGFYKGRNDSVNGVLGYAAHGGRNRKYGTGKLHNQAFDSVFAPCLPGVSVPEPNGQGRSTSGGVTKLVVTGHLAVNGQVNANGSPEKHNQGGNCGSGQGGAIDITAGSISGTGTISANGGSYGWHRGAGGRIAIKLTGANADFSDYTGTIFASGRRRDGSSADSSAGTVYLETAADGAKCGTVKIAMMPDSQGSNTNTTEMVSLGYGGDAIADYKRVNYVVSTYGRAAVNTNMQARSVFLADQTSYLDLEGHALKVNEFRYVTTVDNVPVVRKLTSGHYDFADLSGIPNIVDTSADDTGSIDVSGYGMTIIIR